MQLANVPKKNRQNCEIVLKWNIKERDTMFKDKLKQARLNAGFSQEKVADTINIARSNISKYEIGTLEPNIQTLKELCKLYKVSADYLLEISFEGE